MVVHDRVDVEPPLKDFAVDVAFEIERDAGVGDRVAVEVEFQDILGGDQFRRHRAREQVAFGVSRGAQAYMPIGIDHPMGGENPVGQNKLVPLAHNALSLLSPTGVVCQAPTPAILPIWAGDATPAATSRFWHVIYEAG